MKRELLCLYKIRWRGTANTYVACSIYAKTEQIAKAVRDNDQRCDDIVGIERIKLPAFDGDKLRKMDFIEVFTEMRIF